MVQRKSIVKTNYIYGEYCEEIVRSRLLKWVNCSLTIDKIWENRFYCRYQITIVLSFQMVWSERQNTIR